CEALVKLLRDLQCALGTEAAPVRVPLQTGKIVKKRRRLRGWLAFFGRDTGFSDTAVLDFVRGRLVPDPFRARVFVAVFSEIFLNPTAAISAGLNFEVAEDLIIITRLELVDLVFALGQNCEGRSLHASDRRQLETAGAIIERRHRAGAVDPDQPVTFGPAHRRL